LRHRFTPSWLQTSPAKPGRSFDALPSIVSYHIQQRADGAQVNAFSHQERFASRWFLARAVGHPKAVFEFPSEFPSFTLRRMNLLQQAIDDAVATARELARLEPSLNRAAELVLRSLKAGHKLLVCGNGGSASDATHLATEFLCRYREDRRPYPAISLTANGEFMTAVCNDYNAEEIFARQVWGLGAPGDVLVAFTSSGKSRNVLRALEEAKARGLDTICFLGRDGGYTKGVATLDLLAPGSNTARIQEAHKLLFHVLCETVEAGLPRT
jgi:phosphoheptose isomerase